MATSLLEDIGLEKETYRKSLYDAVDRVTDKICKDAKTRAEEGNTRDEVLGYVRCQFETVLELIQTYYNKYEDVSCGPNFQQSQESKSQGEDGDETSLEKGKKEFHKTMEEKPNDSETDTSEMSSSNSASDSDSDSSEISVGDSDVSSDSDDSTEDEATSGVNNMSSCQKEKALHLPSCDDHQKADHNISKSFSRKTVSPQMPSQQHDPDPLQLDQDDPDPLQTDHSKRPECQIPPVTASETEEDTKGTLTEGINSLMDKLTPANVSNIQEEITSLGFSCLADMQELVTAVHEKAVMETERVYIYGHFCKAISGMQFQHALPELTPNNIEGQKLMFGQRIADKCRHEFHVNRHVLLENPHERCAEIEQDRKSLLHVRPKKMTLIRDRFYGNVRFIGELMTQNMVPREFVSTVIQDLLKAESIHNFKCLCQLLLSVGQAFDEDVGQGKPQLVKILSSMREFSEGSSCPTIKQMFQQVIDVRNNNWSPLEEGNLSEGVGLLEQREVLPSRGDQVYVSSQGFKPDPSVAPILADSQILIKEPQMHKGGREHKHKDDKSIENDATLLHQCENPWKPRWKQQSLGEPVSNTSRNTNTGPLDFTPSFFQAGNNQRHPPQMGKSSSRGRQRPDVQMPQRTIKSVSILIDVTLLHQSEKPWKPAQKQQTAGEAAEKRKSLESEVLFIMNRLTPTNFDRLAKEMQKLDIKTYDDLQELVKIFFDKVAMETKFVEAYAQLCKVIAGMRVPPPPDSGIKDNQCTFRVMMLTKCQQEFEADKSIIFEDPEEKKKKIEAEMPEGPERAEKIENTLYQMKLKRLKFYGNIRFIGELFKLGMLTENIMHDCIFRLLKARDDDSLVSLCNLITTVGQNLDTDKAKQRMDQYFNQMAKIADERKSRIKFTLKDAIDLRNNNWVPRKEQAGPKKIGDIHKDFIQEQATKQFLQSQPLPPRNDPQPNSRRGSRQRQDEKPNDDGWNTVGSKSIRIDASKMKLSKNVVDENNIQLGPGGGMNKFSMWSRGSFGGAQPTQDDRQAPANRFSALRNDEDRRNFQRSPSRGDNSVASRGMRQGNTVGHGRGKIPPRSSTEGERRDALASARSIVGRSQNSSRDNSWNREDRRPSMGPRSSREGENPMTRSDISLRPKTDSLLPPSAAPSASLGASSSGQVKKLKPMTEEEMEHKAKTILEEYLNIRDLEEAKLCVMELEGQEYIHALVSASLNDVLERSTKDRELTGQFFSEMVNNKLLSLDKYLQGLSDVLQYAEDMVIDIPKMWSCLAQMISPMLLGGALTLARLQASFKPNLADKCCAKLLAEILLIIKEQSSESEAAQMWQSSGCKWSDYLSADEVNEFIKDKKLGYLENPVTASSGAPRSAHQDLDRLTDDIEKLVRDNSSNSQIFAYIDKHVPGDKQEKTFIRALMTAVAKSSISDKMKANEEVIKARKDVLHRYIKNTPELELQALYAIQALMHKLEHPSGVIVSLFDTLYDEEVITEDAFKKWEKSSDPQELEGKGPCSLQLTQFFTWLTENEEPETSS